MSFKLPKWEYLRYDIAYYLKRLDMGKLAGVNPWIMGGITCVCAFILLLAVKLVSAPAEKVPQYHETTKSWYYDLNTKKLFVCESDEIPPIEAPSGSLSNGEPAGVRAYVFSYSSRPDESTRFVGFLEKYSIEAKKEKLASAGSVGKKAELSVKALLKGRFFSTPDDGQWFPADSPKGLAIMEKYFTPNEKGQQAHYCQPD